MNLNALIYMFFILIAVLVFLKILINAFQYSKKVRASRAATIQRRVVRTIRIQPPTPTNASQTTTTTTTTTTPATDRQGNIFTIGDDHVLSTRRPSYPDIVILEANNDDNRRLRAQLDKDDKDLPTYDEVMAVSTPNSSNIVPIVAATNPALPLDPAHLPPAPPYCEVDPINTPNFPAINTVETRINERTTVTPSSRV